MVTSMSTVFSFYYYKSCCIQRHMVRIDITHALRHMVKMGITHALRHMVRMGITHALRHMVRMGITHDQEHMDHHLCLSKQLLGQ